MNSAHSYSEGSEIDGDKLTECDRIDLVEGQPGGGIYRVTGTGNWNVTNKPMSKNLSKASDWAQREIDDLEKEAEALHTQANSIAKRMEEVDAKIQMLNEIKEKLNANVSQPESPEKVNNNENSNNK